MFNWYKKICVFELIWKFFRWNIHIFSLYLIIHSSRLRRDNMNNIQKSLIAILICYFSWGLFPIYFKLLKEIGAYEVLAMRIICSFVFMIIVVAIAKNKKSIFNEITTLWKDKTSVLLLVLASFLITLNWLTYIIAVNTNHVLEASFGYYLNPIVKREINTYTNNSMSMCWRFFDLPIYFTRISSMDFYITSTKFWTL